MLLKAISTAHLILLTLLAGQAGAQSVLRCEDADGHITFTTLGCAQNQTLRHQRAHNPPPGSVNATSESRPNILTRLPPRPLVIVAGDDDGCGNVLSRTEKRRAIINQRALSGMNRQEIESALGKPDKVSNNNTTTRYVYMSKKGRGTQVIFDEKGCVKR